MAVTGTPVTVETQPITRAEAKAWLRIDADDDNENDILDNLIVAATEHCEQYLKRTLMTTTRTLYLDAFENTIPLPWPPLRSVTSIAYIDPDGDSQTLDSGTYDVFTETGDSRGPGTVRIAYGQSWPSIRAQHNAITITYSAGYGTGSDVPSAIKQGLLWLVAHMYEHREAVGEDAALRELPMGVERIWSEYRIREIA